MSASRVTDIVELMDWGLLDFWVKVPCEEGVGVEIQVIELARQNTRHHPGLQSECIRMHEIVPKHY